MPRHARRRPTRIRVGKVSVYLHHGAWWIYYRDAGKPVRRKVAATAEEAEQVAAQVNAQLANGIPTMLAFQPIEIPDLRESFLAYHEGVLNSAVATVRRYRAATQHLENFGLSQSTPLQAHNVLADAFASYLRRIEVAPNGHPNSAKRRLRGKGIQFVLETCRAMFAFAAKRRHLPPYAGNPFAELPIHQLKIEDAKPIFVFDAATELAFFQAAGAWDFPIHFVLAKTGLRVGELTHLLIEDLDLATGWLHVRNKIVLGWRIKTANERMVPLAPEVVSVLRQVAGARTSGVVFLRQRLVQRTRPLLSGSRRDLEAICADRQQAAGVSGSRADLLQCARTIWRDAGAVKSDSVRTSFSRISREIGHPEATCPKSWRHTFATLLQDANVDPLIRQITLGHKPTHSSGLGMTGVYTHTRRETQRRQIEAALRLWPESLNLVRFHMEGIER